MSNPQVAIDISANDRTAKGIGSADKRFKKLGGDVEKIGGKSGLGNLAKTFAEVDRAAAKTFGTRSALGSIGDKAAAFRSIGSAIGSGLGRSSVSAMGRAASAASGVSTALGEATTAAVGAEAGMGEAAAAAGGLAVAMGPVGIAVGAVAVTLGAAAAAGYKFASGWAANTAQLGRFAEMIGVTTSGLQQLQGAGERYGIGKDATNSAVSSFAQNIHDARYGRNNDTLALMQRLGVKFRTGRDGNLDYDAMLADTSDALARQRDPQTRLMIANRLGVAGMLPLLSKGSRNLRSEEADVARHGVVNSDQAIVDAQRFNRDSVMMGQMADRKKQQAQAWTTSKYAPVMDKGVSLGRDALDGRLGLGAAAKGIGEGAAKFVAAVSDAFVPAASAMPPAAKKFDFAAGGMVTAAQKFNFAADRMLRPHQAPGASAKFDGSFASAIRVFGERSKDGQVSRVGARGFMQVMPKTAHNPGMGIRPAADESLAEYNRVGVEYANALLRKYGGDWALASAAYNAGPGNVDRLLRLNGDPRKGQISDADWIARIPDGKHSGAEERKYAERVYHVHEFHGLPAGASVKSRTKGSPAISMSFSD